MNLIELLIVLDKVRSDFTKTLWQKSAQTEHL